MEKAYEDYVKRKEKLEKARKREEEARKQRDENERINAEAERVILQQELAYARGVLDSLSGGPSGYVAERYSQGKVAGEQNSWARVLALVKRMEAARGKKSFSEAQLEAVRKMIEKQAREAGLDYEESADREEDVEDGGSGGETGLAGGSVGAVGTVSGDGRGNADGTDNSGSDRRKAQPSVGVSMSAVAGEPGSGSSGNVRAEAHDLAWRVYKRADKMDEFTDHIEAIVEDLEGQGVSDEIIVAAYMHDAIEDGYISWEEAVDLMGQMEGSDRIMQILDAVTRREGEMYTDYIDRVSQDEDATMIKRADLRNNMGRGGGAKESLMKRYKKAVAQLDAADKKRAEGKTKGERSEKLDALRKARIDSS